MKSKNEKNRMVIVFKQLAALVVLSLISLGVAAQKSTIISVFAKNGIDLAILNPESTKAPADYAYEVKQATTTAGKTELIIANYDPSKAQAERWNVSSKNEKSPSKGDISSFRKDKAKEQMLPAIDENSFKIEQETASELVFSYKVSATGLSKENAFMKDCRTFATVDLASKRLRYLRTVNEKPVEIAILTADKFSVNSTFIFIGKSKRYFPAHEEVNMEAKFMGQAVKVETVIEYSNYSKK